MEEAADLSAAVLALQVDLLQLPPEIPAPGAPALRGVLDNLFAHWLLPDTVALVNYLVQKAKASGGGGPGIAGAAMLPSMMLQGGASVPPLSPRSPRLARRPSGVGAGQPNRSASPLRSAAAHPAKEVISQVQTFPRSIFAPRMFYFFFESRGHKENPVVIWLTGGPGCSSELALFYENGPFHIADNMSLVWNDFGWDQESNLIYVDQPTGTGFSYSSYSGDTRHNEASVSNDLYDFLQAFFTEHPKYAKNDFYITGESYAGHYIPALASRVHQGNKNNEGIHINLKGFAIGNGLTDPAIQYKAYTDYALDMGLITQSQFNRINKIVPTCEFAIKLCGTSGTVSCLAAYFVCNVIFGSIRIIIGSKNVGKPCVGSLCYDFSNMEKFLNLKSVRESLGVGDIEFVSCSPTVYEAMLLDWMRNLEVGIPELLENDIKVLIYAGEYDLICNWLGVSYYKEKVGRKEVHKLKLPVLPSDHFGLVLTITHQDENF